jgi:hypothetical protein
MFDRRLDRLSKAASTCQHRCALHGVDLVKSLIGFCLLTALTMAAPASPAASLQSDNAIQPTTESDHLDRVAAFEEAGPPADPAYLTALSGLALFYVDQARYAEAIPVLRRALEASARIVGPDHELTREIRATLLLTEAFVNRR